MFKKIMGIFKIMLMIFFNKIKIMVFVCIKISVMMIIELCVIIRLLLFRIKKKKIMEEKEG